MALREVIARLGYKVDKSSEGKVQGSIKGLLGSVKGLVSNFGLAFGVAELVRGYKTIINLASDASESVNQLNAIFGETASTVSEGMNRIARETGRSEFEMTKFGASMGALLKPLLGSAEGAAKMTEEVVSLTADMSSFMNITQEAALEKFRAGLIGSSEPLIAHGIDVREAALAQFALSKGITKSTKDMKTAEKTALRFELIASKLGELGAIGDAARTSREGANAFRAVGQAMLDLGTRMGQFFLPMATKSANAMTDFVRELDGSVRSGGKLAKVLRFVTNLMELLGDAFSFVADNAKVFAIGLAIIAALLFPVTALFIALGVAILLVAEDLKVMGEGGESAIGTLITGFQDLVKEVGLANAIVEVLKTTLDNLSPDLFKDIAEFFGLRLATPEQLQRYQELEENARRLAAVAPPAFAFPAPTAAQAGGATSVTQTTSVNVTVNAAESPEATGRSVAEQVGTEIGRQNRQAANAMTVASGG